SFPVSTWRGRQQHAREMPALRAFLRYQSGVARERSDADNVLHLGPASCASRGVSSLHVLSSVILDTCPFRQGCSARAVPAASALNSARTRSVCSPRLGTRRLPCSSCWSSVGAAGYDTGP